jgi:3-oxoadipate CoA-transferase alpha subunit
VGIDKFVGSVAEAVSGISDGAVVLVGGFGGGGTPNNLVEALVAQGARDLTVVASGFGQVWPLIEAGQVRRFISSFPLPWEPDKRRVFLERHGAGELAIEIVPQGTLVERIRAGGAGIPAFYCPVGAGTELAAGKEERRFDGRPCLLETAIRGDVALIKAHRGDPYGNVDYRLAARNYNPLMATAADLTIAELDEAVPLGALDPAAVVTPGIYVDRLIPIAKRVVWTYMGPRGASPARASVERNRPAEDGR